MKYKIILRKIKKGDLEKIMIWRMSPDVAQYSYTNPILDKAKQEKWYKNIQNDKHCKYWMIMADNTDIGIVGLTDIDNNNKRCALAWYIGDGRYRGRGIGKTVQLNVLKYVFNNLNFNRFYSEVLSINRNAINLHLKCGLEIEGTMKEHIFKNGEFYDVVIMSITESRWKKIKSEYQFDEVVFEE